MRVCIEGTLHLDVSSMGNSIHLMNLVYRERLESKGLEASWVSQAVLRRNRGYDCLHLCYLSHVKIVPTNIKRIQKCESASCLLYSSIE